MGGGVVRPGEFWGLRPIEAWWLIESRQPARQFGKMSETEISEIYEDAYGAGPLPEWRAKAFRRGQAVRKAHRAKHGNR